MVDSLSDRAGFAGGRSTHRPSLILIDEVRVGQTRFMPNFWNYQDSIVRFFGKWQSKSAETKASFGTKPKIIGRSFCRSTRYKVCLYPASLPEIANAIQIEAFFSRLSFNRRLLAIDQKRFCSRGHIRCWSDSFFL